jgi:hypothetical protein
MSTTAQRLPEKKRAHVATTNEDSVDMDSFKKYEVISTSPVRLRLFSASGAEALEVGLVHANSGILVARYDGRVYAGYKDLNPGTFAADGTCVLPATPGVSTTVLCTAFATPSTIKTPTIPSTLWNAGFKILPAPAHENDALSFRLYFTTPFIGLQERKRDTFQIELVLHAFDGF